MKRRALIFCGGRLGKWALDEIREGDVLIGADAGALFLLDNGFVPDYALGDFDAVPPAARERIQSHSRHFRMVDAVDKDATDSEMAWELAVGLKIRAIVMLGALGSRQDHSLANIHLLSRAAEEDIEGMLVDEFNRIRLAEPGRPLRLRQGPYSYVSLLPLSPVVEGITIDGFMYPLKNATLRMGWTRGVSNRLVAAFGVISVQKGQLLVIESRDESRE